MKVILTAHTQLSEEFKNMYDEAQLLNATDGQAVALTAIRTCYSANKPSEIIELEGDKYFGTKATDGGEGTEADRLARHIVRSGHTSTLEHLSFTFILEGVSRSLLAQLTRHRAGFGFSVQSQRYVRFGSEDKSRGFNYVTPPSIGRNGESRREFESVMDELQVAYDTLRTLGVTPEDARAVLPNAATTNLVLTVNLRALLDFYSKRKAGKGGQFEITQLAEALKDKAVSVEPWVSQFFEGEASK